jgi:hypothetical protein
VPLRLVVNAQNTAIDEKRSHLLQFFLQVFCMQERRSFHDAQIEKDKRAAIIKADLLFACRQQLLIHGRLNRLLLLGACVSPLANCIVPFMSHSSVPYLSVPAAIISFLLIASSVYSWIYHDQLTEFVAQEIDKNQKKWEQDADILSTFFMIWIGQKRLGEAFIG